MRHRHPIHFRQDVERQVRIQVAVLQRRQSVVLASGQAIERVRPGVVSRDLRVRLVLEEVSQLVTTKERRGVQIAAWTFERQVLEKSFALRALGKPLADRSQRTTKRPRN